MCWVHQQRVGAGVDTIAKQSINKNNNNNNNISLTNNNSGLKNSNSSLKNNNSGLKNNNPNSKINNTNSKNNDPNTNINPNTTNNPKKPPPLPTSTEMAPTRMSLAKLNAVAKLSAMVKNLKRDPEEIHKQKELAKKLAKERDIAVLERFNRGNQNVHAERIANSIAGGMAASRGQKGLVSKFVPDFVPVIGRGFGEGDFIDFGDEEVEIFSKKRNNTNNNTKNNNTKNSINTKNNLNANSNNSNSSSSSSGSLDSSSSNKRSSRKSNILDFLNDDKKAPASGGRRIQTPLGLGDEQGSKNYIMLLELGDEQGSKTLAYICLYIISEF